MNRHPDFKKLTNRPRPEERLFHSDVIEDATEEIASKIGDSEIRQMFRQTFPSALDTAVSYREIDGKPDTYIATGDIPAMWPRDTAAEVSLYLPYANRDEKLQKMLSGVVFRLTECILIDPYANAYRHPHMKRPPRSYMWGFGNGWHKGVWERKYELDSLCAFLQYSSKYYEATGDMTPFDSSWVKAASKVLNVIRAEQGSIEDDEDDKPLMYRALRPNGKPMPKFNNDGKGPTNKEVGLSRCLYRPSDDEVELPYLIPANAMAVVALNSSAEILRNIAQGKLATEFESTAYEIDTAIQQYGIVDDPRHGRLYAYEVDGFDGPGHYRLMDDPNVPSLLSLPILGYGTVNDRIWKRTREFILSDDHEHYVKGKYEGLGSPHTPKGYIWPIATSMRILTSTNEAEKAAGLKTLRDTHAGTRFMHESFNANNPRRFTRPHFVWANSLFAETVIDTVQNTPWILKQELK